MIILEDFSYNIWMSLLFLTVFGSCSSKFDNYQKNQRTPIFNADSAYHFVEIQLNFGYRVPNTPAHDSCAKFLKEKLETYCDNVLLQEANVFNYKKDVLKIYNIIGQFQPDKKKRLLLFAHWDSRFRADFSTDTAMIDAPILGANDGASGVAVLLEIARNLRDSVPDVGVDIIFFDAEDQGEPIDGKNNDIFSWCLGSQYWSYHLLPNNYKAEFAICVDMVGGKGACFTKEDNSRHFASLVVREIWKTADALGYSSTFCEKRTHPVVHDHLFVNEIAKIPSILIMEYDESTKYKFNRHWHTHNDNLENIDKESLRITGHTLLEVIFNQK